MNRLINKKIFLGLSFSCIFTFLCLMLILNSIDSFKKVEQINFSPTNKEPILNEQAVNVPFWQVEFNMQSQFPPVAGQISAEKKLLTIGISTVYRPENYLQQTLQSLVNQSTASERKDTIVVIFLADIQYEKRQMQFTMIEDEFRRHLESGFFQVIASGREIYPPMFFTTRYPTYNDSADRVLWRAKQVIDFAFLFSYGKDLSTYYLVLEDDILSAPRYITSVKEFICQHNMKPKTWTALHFTQFVGIGLLFRNSEISKLTQFLILFHQVQPLDELMRQYIGIQAPEEELPQRIPSVFQHIGIKSSLPEKIQIIQDDTFGRAVVLGYYSSDGSKHTNPEATIVTTMKAFDTFLPQFPYQSSNNPFLATCGPCDTFDIIFLRPLPIQRVVVFTGLPYDTVPSYRIADGATLEAGNVLTNITTDKTKFCDNLVPFSNFVNGTVDVQTRNNPVFNSTINLSNIQCLRIKLGINQLENDTIAIFQILVFSTI